MRPPSPETQILIVEDEENLLNSLAFILEREGFQVLRALTGEEALPLACRHRPQLALLDLGLPGMDGLELAERLRSSRETGGILIIMVTGSCLEEDMVRALDSFADDYVTKPVRPRVLLSRIHAVLRRRVEPEKDAEIIRLNGLVIDPAAVEAALDGVPLGLTKTEFDILQFLSRHPNRAYSRDAIIDHIRGTGYFVMERSIDYQICSLRKKLGARGDMIETVRGTGYKLRHE
jgi:DNA-binding response OmpR family regulator